jgi:hypothetical protein
MPVRLFTEVERARRNRFPKMIGYEDLVGFFTLSERDLDSIPRFSAAYNRLGYALQLCALRFMGFVPDDLTSVPPAAVAFLARQLGVDADVLAAYGARAHTRQDHLHAAQVHLGYRKVGREDFKALADWLLERALEHDKPTPLYELTCEKLRAEQFIRPGVTRLERLVAEARQQAQAETFRRLGPLLRDDCMRFLDTLLASDPDRDMTRLAWLRRPAVSNSPRAILEYLDELAFLRTAGVEHWDLEGSNPNRPKLLAQLARRSSAQSAPARPRSGAIRFWWPSLIDVTGEVLRCSGMRSSPFTIHQAGRRLAIEAAEFFNTAWRCV